jgi:hypothetical protein
MIDLQMFQRWSIFFSSPYSPKPLVVTLVTLLWKELQVQDYSGGIVLCVQHGAPPHFRTEFVLVGMFPGEWIGRGGPAAWPLCSQL